MMGFYAIQILLFQPSWEQNQLLIYKCGTLFMLSSIYFTTFFSCVLKSYSILFYSMSWWWGNIAAFLQTGYSTVI